MAESRVSEYPEVVKLVNMYRQYGANRALGIPAKVTSELVGLDHVRRQGKEVLRLLAGPAGAISSGILFSSLGRRATFRKWLSTAEQLAFVGLVDLTIALDEAEYGEARAQNPPPAVQPPPAMKVLPDLCPNRGS